VTQLNILELTTSAMVANAQPANGSQKSSEAGNGGFNSVLSGLMGQTSTANPGTTESGIPTDGSADVKAQLLAMIESNGSSANVLGLDKNMLSLVAALLNGSQSAEDQKALLGMLVSAFNNLAKSSESEPVDLLKMLKMAQDPGQGKSLIDSLRSALESLSDDLKAKLQKTDGKLDAGLFSSADIAAIQAVLTPIFTAISDADSTKAAQVAQAGGGVPVSSTATLAANMNSNPTDIASTTVQNVSSANEDSLETTGLLKGQSSNDASMTVADKHAGHGSDSKDAGQEIAKIQETTKATADNKASESTKQAVSGLNANQDDALKRMSQTEKSAQDTSSKEVSIAGTEESGKAVAKSSNTENSDKKGGTQKESESGGFQHGSLTENGRTAVSSSSNASSQQAQTYSATSAPITTPAAGTMMSTDMKQAGITTQQSSGMGFIEADNFTANLMGKLDIMISEGKTEAKIKLKPESLGELKIHLMMDGGSMKAVLSAATPHAKELIEANLGALKQSLEGNGIQVKEFEVSVNQQNDHSNQGHMQHRQRSSSRGFANLGSIEPSALNQPILARNYLTSNGSMAVNYLA
jgi:flagellar hook-length control protein FliK